MGALCLPSVLLVSIIAEQIMANLGQHTGFVSEFPGTGISAWLQVLCSGSRAHKAAVKVSARAGFSSEARDPLPSSCRSLAAFGSLQL